jgi:hypothetical protein
LPSKSDTVTLTRAITVAAGVYAPGHLGELTRQVPFELVDAVLAETGTVQRRLRVLPSRVGVYLVLAMGLFEQVGLTGVWSKLVAGLGGLAVPSPSEKALRDLRRRIGPEPVKALFHVLAGPLAWPRTPGVCYRGMRTVAFDGCSSLKVPDHERNRQHFGKIKHRVGFAGYPTLMLMALVETGTRAVIGAVFGPTTQGERAYAGRLLGHLRAGMLLLCDRGFDSDQFLAQVAGTGAHLLIRARGARRPPVLALLPDGSYLTDIGALRLRVIEARVTVTGADGCRAHGVYRLVTTLTDHRLDPAPALVALYHERWEVESAFYALRHTLLRGRVLRSKDPVGIEQEIWGLLVLYQALRIAMLDACRSIPGTDPDRAPFTAALEAARDSVTPAHGLTPLPADPIGGIGRAVLEHLLRPRRPRLSARKVKCPISRYHDRTDTGRPPASTTITALDVTITQPVVPHQPRQPTGRWRAVRALLRRDPGRPWRARDIATALNDHNPHTLTTQLAQWSHDGLLHKTAPATYTLTHQDT